MSKSIGIGILGGTGYGAGELLRLLCQHPEAEAVSVVSSSNAGKKIEQHHTFLKGFYPFTFDSELNLKALTKYKHKVVFAALPHGVSGKVVEALSGEAKRLGIKIIDISGDLRLKDASLRQRFYPEVNVAQSFKDECIYGLPEVRSEEIKRAQFISNPGCLAVSSILSLAPIVNEIDGMVHLNAKTGSSGAGRTPQPAFHHPQLHANCFAYKMLEHRHEPEIKQELEYIKGAEVLMSFVPHVIPVSRGIYITAHFCLKREMLPNDLLFLYKEFYKESPFIRVREISPQLEYVVGSNFCDVFITSRGKTAIAIAVLDNLVKGMTGLAIQNMNLMCGLDETLGLWQPSFGPI